jgi:hypothetical protein
MTARVIDFDQFRAEKNEEPIDFIIGGEHYALPPALPASLAVDMMRIQTLMEDDEDIPDETMIDFGKSLFGEDMWVDLMKKHRITITEISPLMEKVLEQYTNVPKEETLESETSGTRTSGSASSTTGRGSKRTSSASTASTSKTR